MTSAIANVLPVTEVLDEFAAKLRERDEVVLQAPPGAGKTTLVPLHLLAEPWLGQQKILLLEPRRLAARAAAERMASLLGESVGNTVGYRVRLDSNVSVKTRIEVITEGVLTRQLQDDPALSGVGAVIFDEFHERSLDADLGLALCLYGRELFRDGEPLKLIVMSATLDDAAVAHLLNNAPVVTSQGRSYPVELRYVASPNTRTSVSARAAEATITATREYTGSVLVFLPGQREIRETELALKHALTNDSVCVYPLFGDLTLAQQRKAIAPATNGQRKIVLATNIAQTSLTIEGVSVVIDAGLTRRARFDPRTGLTRLATVRVSRADAEQRAGRAGRTEAGVCYRLWPESEQRQLGAFTPPEIADTDLSNLALQLLKFGVGHPDELRWLDPPRQAPWQQAVDLLSTLGAIVSHEQTGLSLTQHGEYMASMPAHPRLAHLLIRAVQAGVRKTGCDLAALLSSRDVVTSRDVDLAIRVRLIQHHTPATAVNRASMREVRQLSERFMKITTALPRTEPAHEGLSDDQAIAYLLACAYPDRIARRRQASSSTYQLANGRAASLQPDDALVVNEWLVIADAGGQAGHSTDVIYLAVALDPALFESSLAHLVELHEHVSFDSRKSHLQAEEQHKVGRLVIRRVDLQTIDSQVKRQVLIDYIRKSELKVLSFSDKVNQWRARVEFLRERDVLNGQESEWPDVSDVSLVATLDDWLGPYIDGVSHVNHFARIDTGAILSHLLSWSMQQKLDELAPAKIQVPSGSLLPVDYSQRPPVLAVRLQEMFGSTTTPSVADGVMLSLHLLSPARRPIQVTQDLEGFWQGSYREVQKDMKGRYPKHHWPDDPLSARPTHRTTRPRGA